MLCSCCPGCWTYDGARDAEHTTVSSSSGQMCGRVVSPLSVLVKMRSSSAESRFHNATLQNFSQNGGNGHRRQTVVANNSRNTVLVWFKIVKFNVCIQKVWHNPGLAASALLKTDVVYDRQMLMSGESWKQISASWFHMNVSVSAVNFRLAVEVYYCLFCRSAIRVSDKIR